MGRPKSNSGKEFAVDKFINHLENRAKEILTGDKDHRLAKFQQLNKQFDEFSTALGNKLSDVSREDDYDYYVMQATSLPVEERLAYLTRVLS